MRIHSVTDPRICSIRLPDMRVVELKVTYKGTECECRGLVLQVSALPDLVRLAELVRAGGERNEMYCLSRDILKRIGTI